MKDPRIEQSNSEPKSQNPEILSLLLKPLIRRLEAETSWLRNQKAISEFYKPITLQNLGSKELLLLLSSKARLILTYHAPNQFE